MPSRSVLVDITKILPPSLLAERLQALDSLYAEVDAAVEAFASASGVACPFGCGACCESFVPDVLPIEAEYLASWLASSDPGRAYSFAANGISAMEGPEGRESCALYALDTPYHCTVYEARPLICRMFAFSSTRDKLGRPTFAACGRATVASAPRRAVGADLVKAYGSEPPVMADFGARLAAIDPAAAPERRALPKALSAALSKVLFLIGLPDGIPPGAGPHLRPPLPRAG